MYPRLNYKLDVSSFISLINPLNINKSQATNLDIFFPDNRIFTINNARSGLKTILSMFKGSVVGVQAFTCPTVLEAIESAGCVIHFIDINKHFCLDIDSLKKESNKIDILIITHTFGYAVNIDEIKPFLKGKILIEDCAHSFLLKKNSDYTGTKADFSIFSFGFGKFPNAVTGGFIMCNNSEFNLIFNQKFEEITSRRLISEIIDRCKSLANIFLHNWFIYSIFTQKFKDFITNNEYHKSEIKKTYKAYSFSIDILNKTLQKIGYYLEIQINNAIKIEQSAKSNAKFEIPHNAIETNGFMYLLNVEKPNELIRYAKKHGIEFGKHFYKSKYIINEFGYKQGQCANYELLIEKYVTIPCHYNYPQKAISKIVKILKEY